MDLSMNEVEAQARKAAKGAGYSWGESEEVGKAVRWLCQRGVDGCADLAELLQAGPHSKSCPIRLGIQLSDTARNLKDNPMSFDLVSYPMLMVPFAAFASAQIEKPLKVHTDTWSAAVDESAFEKTGESVSNLTALEVALATGQPKPTALLSRAHPDAQTWETLSKFAHRTYAPATEESRMLGAGAGLSDND